MPRASGVPNRATSNASGPERIRVVARSFILVSRALETGDGNLMVFSEEGARPDEARGQGVVVAARPFLGRGIGLIVAHDARHQDLAHPFADQRSQHHERVLGVGVPYEMNLADAWKTV